MLDLRSRLTPGRRIQITSDGFGSYPIVIDALWRGNVDYAQQIKDYTDPTKEDQRRYSPATCKVVETKILNGDPDPAHISTSYVERQNLTMRMGMRRFTRLTNGFSKKVENLAHAVSLHYMHYNFARPHQSLTIKQDGARAIKQTRRWPQASRTGSGLSPTSPPCSSEQAVPSPPMPAKRPRRRRFHAPSWRVAIVAQDEFVAFQEARAALGFRTQMPLNMMIFTGTVQAAATGPAPWYEGDVGVTASSLAPEAAQWSSASKAGRGRRFLRLCVRQLARSV